MADLKMKTDAVVSAANNIKNYNTQMKDGLTRVENSIRQMNNAWDGNASNAAISKFNQIKSSFHSARYNVLDNYVNFLLQQVGQGYTQTEDSNVSLSDMFK